MKKFLIGLLTILLTLVFIVLGISLTIEKTITENISEVVKEEVTTEIVNEVAKNANVDKEQVKKELNELIEKNEVLKKTLEESLDKAVDMLSGKEVEDLNFTKELEDVINNSEEVLKDYGITISKKEKQKLLDMVNNDELNSELQQTIKEAQESMPESVKIAIDAFSFIRSTTCKVILIISIIIILLCIALLKKSYFKWLSNLGVVTLICGIFYSFVVSFFIDIVSKEFALNSKNIVLSVGSMSAYGYSLIGIGIVSLVLNIILSKTIHPKTKIQND